MTDTVGCALRCGTVTISKSQLWWRFRQEQWKLQLRVEPMVGAFGSAQTSPAAETITEGVRLILTSPAPIEILLSQYLIPLNCTQISHTFCSQWTHIQRWGTRQSRRCNFRETIHFSTERGETYSSLVFYYFCSYVHSICIFFKVVCSMNASHIKPHMCMYSSRGQWKHVSSFLPFRNDESQREAK